MKIAIIASAWLLLALAAPASAQQISGSYEIEFEQLCQGSPSATGPNGSVFRFLGTGNFVPDGPDGGNVTVAGNAVQGSLIFKSGNDMTQVPIDASLGYSNTPTTLTIQGIVYSAIYNRVAANIPGKVSFNGLVSAACVAHGVLEKVR